MHDVFISYSSKDFDSVEAVRNVLESNHIPCWMAPIDIPPGSNYAKEIPAAIRSCQVFLLILSERAQQSHWVPKELDTAISCGKPIIPFVLEACSLNDEFNFLLNGVHRFEAYKKKSEVMEVLVSRIYAITGKRPTLPPDPFLQESADLTNDHEITDLSEGKEPDNLSGEQLACGESAPDKAVAEPRRCPVCGSDRVVIRNKFKKVGKAAAAGAGTVMAGALAGPFGAFTAGFFGVLSNAELLFPTEFRCKNCGHEFELKRQNEENNTEAESEPTEASEPAPPEE